MEIDTPTMADVQPLPSPDIGWKRGELVLDSQPTVHVLYSQWKGRRCDMCFRSTNKLRRCSGCKFMFYCSKVCQEQDWNPCHRVECKSKLALALADLAKCVDALGRPRWKSAQIQLAFRLLTRWRLDPNNVWPQQFLSVCVQLAKLNFFLHLDVAFDQTNRLTLLSPLVSLEHN
jgi:hypothetical protein